MEKDKDTLREEFLESLTPSEVVELFDAEDLLDELPEWKIENFMENKGYEFNNSYDEEDEDEIEERLYKEIEENSFILKRDFDRHKLREHLLDITGLGHYVSTEDLLDEIKYLLI